MEAFDPAREFQGARPGWVFQKGSRGLGYYHCKINPPLDMPGANPMTLSLPPGVSLPQGWSLPQSMGMNIPGQPMANRGTPQDMQNMAMANAAQIAAQIAAATNVVAPVTPCAPSDPTLSADPSVTKTLPSSVTWRVTKLRVSRQGAGVNMEATDWGFKVTEVAPSPGQDLTLGDVIVGMDTRSLQNLSEAQLHASFKKRCKDGMVLVVCRIEDLDAAKQMLPDEDGVITGTDPSTGRQYFFNIRTQKSAWTREEAAGFKASVQLASFLDHGFSKVEPAAKKKRKKQEPKAEREQVDKDRVEREAQWNEGGVGGYTRALHDQFAYAHQHKNKKKKKGQFEI